MGVSLEKALSQSISKFTKSKMDTKTIISIALVAVAFLLAEAKPFEETKDDRFMDLNEKAEDYLRELEENSLQRAAVSRNFWDWVKNTAHKVGEGAKVVAPYALQAAKMYAAGDRFVDTNGACNCSRQTSGKCAVTKSLCFSGKCKCSETAGVCVGSCGGTSIASLFGREEAEES